MASRLGIRTLLRRALNRARYEVGRFLLRGAMYRLLFIVLIVMIVAVLGGVAVEIVDPTFADRDEAIWWAFLRLTDPGYLGDDVGFGRRAVSTIISVIGYVLFLGALVAIMTQWLNQTLRRLESGLTPIARDGHVLVAGWTDRTVSILREMYRTEDRSHTLLGRRGARLTAVVLAEEASPELHQELRDRMGEHWREHQVILRQGEPIHLDHLRRADFAHAAAIVLPGDPYLGADHAPSDVRVMKALMSVARHALNELGASHLPYVVAEIFDARREAVAKSLYPGHIEVVASDRLIGRMLALNLRHPGLAHVYRELLFERSGQRMQVSALPEALQGKCFREIVQRLPGAVVLGVMRKGEPMLCPDPWCVIEPEDRLVTFSHDKSVLGEHDTSESEGRLSIVPSMRPSNGTQLRSLLVLGWTRKVPAVLDELLSNVENLVVDVISTSALSERREELGELAHDERLMLHHELGDYTIPGVVKNRELGRYDAVLLVGSDRLESGSESDARSVVGYEVLKHCMPKEGPRPRVVIELMDAENATLIQEPEVEVLVSPQLLGRVLAQVALLPELYEVYNELFGAGGAELAIHRASDYGITAPGSVAFSTLRDAVTRAGHVLLGAQSPDGLAVTLNPPPSMNFDRAPEVRVVVAVRET